MKHTVAALVENHFGVLARVSGLFSARGFNIDSLTVGETEDPTISRMTIVVHGDERVLDQIVKQLGKLVDVIQVTNISQEDVIERELLLAKVTAKAESRGDIMQVVNTFRAKIVDVNPNSMTIEVTGGEGKIDAMLELLRPFGILEVVRTGLIAVQRRQEFSVPGKSETKESSSEKAVKKTVPAKSKKAAK